MRKCFGLFGAICLTNFQCLCLQLSRENISSTLASKGYSEEAQPGLLKCLTTVKWPVTLLTAQAGWTMFMKRESMSSITSKTANGEKTNIPAGCNLSLLRLFRSRLLTYCTRQIQHTQPTIFRKPQPHSACHQKGRHIS